METQAGFPYPAWSIPYPLTAADQSSGVRSVCAKERLYESVGSEMVVPADAFVERLVNVERAQAAATRRPGYNPRDLLKLYLYVYLNQIRSSRRLEAECRRN
jgi:transposase